MVYLKKEKEKYILKNRNPWIFSGALEEGGEGEEDLTPLLNHQGQVVGWGLWSPGSRIALRMVSFGAARPPENWLSLRMERAIGLREKLGIDSDAWRLFNAEGDYLPGLVADLYSGTVVLRPLVRSMEAKTGEICDFLLNRLGKKSIYLKRDEHSARTEKLRLKNGYLHKEPGAREVEVIREKGLNFKVDIPGGQKTGYYLDQRESRSLVETLSQGKKVINCFSYTGGFTLYALRGGAEQIISIDSSGGALETGRENLGLNPELNPERCEWIKADVKRYLPGAEMGDIIILDPPPFARKKSEVEGALKGYRFLNEQALGKVNPGGFLLTFSCSGGVSKGDFSHMLFQAARRSGRLIRLIKELQAPGDHPVSIFHPEGEYLKGWLLYVE